MSDETKLIFVHAQFRTGSTWFWSQFRRLNNCVAYCEPLHELLATLDPNHHEDLFHAENHTDKLRHPKLEKNYFHEYPAAENGIGVTNYKERFAYSRYVLGEDEDDEELETYLRHLVTWKQEKIIAFQPCRTAHRTRWMKRRFGGLHLYLARNPRNQWASYASFDCDISEQQVAFFTMMPFLIASANADSKWFSPLRGIFPLLEIPATNVSSSATLWHKIAWYVSPYQRYFLFIWHWYAAIIDNLSAVDLIVDYDSLADDEVRGELQQFISKYINVPFLMDTYDQKKNDYAMPLTTSQMGEIEAAVGLLMRHFFPMECAAINCSLMISKENWNPISIEMLGYLDENSKSSSLIDLSTIEQIFPSIQKIRICRELEVRSRTMEKALSHADIYEQYTRDLINSMNAEKKCLLNEVKDLRSSEAYRVGYMLMSPLSKLKKLFFRFNLNR